ncbi:MAG: ArsR/SmtB family transcription factor [Christensenellales bacterium]|jgi:DNA-binding transcriptional ArsR family regulator
MSKRHDHEKRKQYVLERFLPDETLEAAAQLLKAMGDPTRTRILFALSVRELCVCCIAELLDMTPSAISHQLRVLRHNKLIKSRRSGREIYYSLADPHIETVLAQAIEHAEEGEHK